MHLLTFNLKTTSSHVFVSYLCCIIYYTNPASGCHTPINCIVVISRKFEHFGIIRFWVMLRTNRQTNRQTEPNILPTPTDSVCMGSNQSLHVELANWPIKYSFKDLAQPVTNLVYCSRFHEFCSLYLALRRLKSTATFEKNLIQFSWSDNTTQQTPHH